jgi:hypothetical protein
MELRLPWAFVTLAVLACNSAPKSQTTAEAAPDTTAPKPAPPADQVAAPGGDKVQEAMSAAPASISHGAAIMEWSDSGGQPKEIRKGTNGWTCFASTPQAVGSSGKDPMCLNDEFATWGQALVNKKKPVLKDVGIGYMLQGDGGVSNIDPFAKAPTDKNEWVKSGPHVMVVVPNASQLAAFPADPKSGGPWVMWKGTPYAHLMVPVQ